jgi:hypothetical protein
MAGRPWAKQLPGEVLLINNDRLLLVDLDALQLYRCEEASRTDYVSARGEESK